MFMQIQCAIGWHVHILFFNNIRQTRKIIFQTNTVVIGRVKILRDCTLIILFRTIAQNTWYLINTRCPVYNFSNFFSSLLRVESNRRVFLHGFADIRFAVMDESVINQSSQVRVLYLAHQRTVLCAMLSLVSNRAPEWSKCNFFIFKLRYWSTVMIIDKFARIIYSLLLHDLEALIVIIIMFISFWNCKLYCHCQYYNVISRCF